MCGDNDNLEYFDENASCYHKANIDAHSHDDLVDNSDCLDNNNDNTGLFNLGAGDGAWNIADDHLNNKNEDAEEISNDERISYSDDNEDSAASSNNNDDNNDNMSLDDESHHDNNYFDDDNSCDYDNSGSPNIDNNNHNYHKHDEYNDSHDSKNGS